MSVKQYRKKPVVIEAVQWNGSLHSYGEVMRFVGYALERPAPNKLLIETLEGDMTADEGDYIIKGVKGEFYPCKPDIFHATYEAVEEPAHE